MASRHAHALQTSLLGRPKPPCGKAGSLQTGGKAEHAARGGFRKENRFMSAHSRQRLKSPF